MAEEIIDNAKKISEMEPLLSLKNEDMMEVVRLKDDGTYGNFRTGVAKLRVGMSIYDLAVQNGYVGTEEEYLESLKGASAYELAVELGQYTGTEEEWVQSLALLYIHDVINAGKVLLADAEGTPVWGDINKTQLGLDQVDNTSDLDKPLSTAIKNSLRQYVLANKLNTEVMRIILALPGFELTEDGQAMTVNVAQIQGLEEYVDARIALANTPVDPVE